MYLIRLRQISVIIAALLSLSQFAPGATTNELINLTNTWRYWETGSLDGTNWKAPDYDDSAWLSGAAAFYANAVNLPAPTNTTLTLGQRTYYFRTHFHYAEGEPERLLLFKALIDDGAVFYLNGVELGRIGMPRGEITYHTFPLRSVRNATSFDAFTVSSSLLTNLAPGDNVLAVEVHQENEESAMTLDLAFAATVTLVTDVLPAVVRAPYLQSGSHTSLTVRWRTDVASLSRVRYGTNLNHLELEANDTLLTTEHEVKLVNLLPETRYYYAVGSPFARLMGGDLNHYFITAPPPGTSRPTRIWVIGDYGWGTAAQREVRDAYIAFTETRHTDVWLTVGDNEQHAGADIEYQRNVFDIYTDLFRKTVIWPTIGNHDIYAINPSGNHPYYDIFTLPQNGEAGGAPSGSEQYYSFDYSNIHFICLDSEEAARTPDGPMARWLSNDLAQVTADWTIAYWHHPPYNPDPDWTDQPKTDGMREVFLPLLEAAGVDLILNGHLHNYLRSFLMNGYYAGWTEFSATNIMDAGSGRETETGVYRKAAGHHLPHQGTVFTIVGSSGEVKPPLPNDFHPALYHVGNVTGSLVVDVDGQRLDAKFITGSGTTNDFFTILKTNKPPRLDFIPDQWVEANQVLILTNFTDVSGTEEAQLNFDLLSAPTGASIQNLSSSTARFIWRPTCEQGGTTHRVTIQVSDAGNPSLTTTQTFQITVPDCVRVTLGRTVVGAGAPTSLPLEVLTTTPLSNLTVQMSYPPERLTSITTLINPQQTLTSSQLQTNAGRLRLALEFQPEHSLRLETDMATLSFATAPGQNSAFVWLPLPMVTAQRPDGSWVTNAYGLAGRTAIVGSEPLLESLRTTNDHIALLQYAQPGSLITMQWTTNLAESNWQSAAPIAQTNLVQKVEELPPLAPVLWFRALRQTNGL